MPHSVCGSGRAIADVDPQVGNCIELPSSCLLVGLTESLSVDDRKAAEIRFFLCPQLEWRLGEMSDWRRVADHVDGEKDLRPQVTWKSSSEHDSFGLILHRPVPSFRHAIALQRPRWGVLQIHAGEGHVALEDRQYELPAAIRSQVEQPLPTLNLATAFYSIILLTASDLCFRGTTQE